MGLEIEENTGSYSYIYVLRQYGMKQLQTHSLAFVLLILHFLNTNREIGWQEHLQNDLFCVKWDSV